MNKSRMLLFLCLMLLIVPNVSAMTWLSGDADFVEEDYVFTWNDAVQGLTLNFTLNLTVPEWRIVNLTYKMQVSSPVLEDDSLYFMEETGDISECNMSFSWDVDGGVLPWNNCNYTFRFIFVYNGSDYEEFPVEYSFYIGEYDSSVDYYISIRDADPYHLDMDGDTSASFYMVTNTDDDLGFHIHGVNGTNRKLRAHGTRYVNVDSDTGDDLVDWSYFETEDIFHLYNFYFCYFGFGTDMYSWSDMEFSHDYSVYPVNYSLATLSLNAEVDEDHSHACKYMGYGVYFRCHPTLSDGGGWDADFERDNSVGGMIDAWANDPVVWGGTPPMPWFSIIVAIIISIIFVTIPLGFSIRSGIDFPNYVYAIVVSASVFLSFSLGLLPLWMFLFYVLAMVFSLMLRYREKMVESIELLRGRPEETQTGFKAIGESRFEGIGEGIGSGFPTWAKEKIPDEYLNVMRKIGKEESRKKKSSLSAIESVWKKKKNERTSISRRDTRWGGHGEVPHPSSYKDSYLKKMKKKGYRIKGDKWVKT